MHKDWFSLFLVSHLLYVIPIFLTSVQHYCSFVVVFLFFVYNELPFINTPSACSYILFTYQINIYKIFTKH